MRAINLNRELPCEYLCHQIQLLINEYKQNNPTVQECVLVMDIKQITEGNTTTSMPLIEHKNELTETPPPLS